MFAVVKCDARISIAAFISSFHMNPLLDFSGLPRFAEIKPEHVAPAIEQLLDENRALVQRLLADDVPPTWDDFVSPMEVQERTADFTLISRTPGLAPGDG
jgi:Zn-dependent oligopeptidase